MKIKQRIYNFTASFGIKTLTAFFPEYFAQDPLAPSDRYLEYPFAIRNLPAPPARILDVGCAGSFFPLLLAGFGYETFAIDIRKYAIVNKIAFKNFCYRNESIIATSFPDDYFDAITAISAVEHIGLSGRYGIAEDPSADKKALVEMSRILKPSGYIVLTVPFGKAKIIKPFHRIYDGAWIQKLIGSLRIDAEEYYLQDGADDWFRCSKPEAEETDATKARSALCLLKLVKE